jgi:hypothetical protein
VIPGFNIVAPNPLTTVRGRPSRVIAGPQLAQAQQSPGFRPLPPMPAPQLSFPSPVRGDSARGLAKLADGLPALYTAAPDPGRQAQVAAVLKDPAVQANPWTSAAGMPAGTNPDVGIGGGMPQPPDGSRVGSSGVGTSPYAAQIPGLVQAILSRNPYLQWLSR